MSEVAHIPQLRFPEFEGSWSSVSILGTTNPELKYGIVDGPFGSNLKTIHYKKSGIPIITSGYVTDGFFNADSYLYVTEEKFNKEKRSAVNGGDIVMAKIGARCGSSAILPKNHPTGILSGNALKITVDNNSHSTNFIWQILWSLYQGHKLDLLRTVGAQPAISIANLKKYKLSLPTKPEQQKIAAFLTEVDTKIEQLSKKQELLGEYKKGLTQQIFSQAIRFKAGDGSDFPDWEEKKLGDVFEIKAGQSKSKHIKKDGKNIIVDMGGISSEPKLVAKKLTDYDDDFLTTNDLVMPKDDIGGGLIIGKVAEIPENNKYICGDHIYKLTVVNGNITFLKYAINSYQVNKSFRQKANGTAQIGLSRKEVENQLLSFPSLKEQTKIANFLSSIDSKIEQVGKQLNESKQFKKALLQQMFV